MLSKICPNCRDSFPEHHSSFDLKLCPHCRHYELVLFDDNEESPDLSAILALAKKAGDDAKENEKLDMPRFWFFRLLWRVSPLLVAWAYFMYWFVGSAVKWSPTSGTDQTNLEGFVMGGIHQANLMNLVMEAVFWLFVLVVVSIVYVRFSFQRR